MKYIRTSDSGIRRPAAVVEQEREQEKNRIIAAGNDYIETQGTFGSRNTSGDCIEEVCYLIHEIKTQRSVSGDVEYVSD